MDYEDCILKQAEINVLGYEIAALENLISTYTAQRDAKVTAKAEAQAEFDAGCVPFPPQGSP